MSYPDWVIVCNRPLGGGDRRVYTALDGPPERAPSSGVELIAIPDPVVGYRTVYGEGFYMWHGEPNWWETGDWRDFCHWRRECEEAGIRPLFLFGYQVPSPDFRDTWPFLNELTEQGILPVKGSKLPNEPPLAT